MKEFYKLLNYIFGGIAILCLFIAILSVAFFIFTFSVLSLKFLAFGIIFFFIFSSFVNDKFW